MAVSVEDSVPTARVISNDVAAVTLSTPRPAFDVTGVDKSAMERLQGLADCKADLDMYWNPGNTPSSHAVFSTVPSSSVARESIFTLTAKVLTVTLMYNDYQIARDQSGEVKCTTTGELSSGTAPTWA